jgi:hypothetical protein
MQSVDFYGGMAQYANVRVEDTYILIPRPSQGSLVGRTLFTYDIAGELLEIKNLDSQGAVQQRIAFSRDAEHKVTETATYGPNGQVLQRERDRIDAIDLQGNWTLITKSKWNPVRNTYEPVERVYRTITYHWASR